MPALSTRMSPQDTMAGIKLDFAVLPYTLKYQIRLRFTMNLDFVQNLCFMEKHFRGPFDHSHPV